MVPSPRSATSSGSVPRVPDAPAELIETLKARNLRDQGIALFDELIREQPQQPKYAFARARYLVELGQRDLAAADLAKAVLHWPNDLSGLKERGRLYALVGRFDEAAAHFGRALELVPQVNIPWTTDDFTGVYPEAVSQPEIFERLVLLRPQDQTLLDRPGSATTPGGASGAKRPRSQPAWARWSPETFPPGITRWCSGPSSATARAIVGFAAGGWSRSDRPWTRC